MAQVLETSETAADVPGEESQERDEPAETTGETENYPLPEDDLFHVLQNERRRAVLRYLDGTEGTVDMRAIAEQVAAWEHDTTVEQLDSDERQRVYIALYQSHLDSLEDVGIIDYEKSRGNVRLTEVGQEVATYMEGVDDDESIEWQEYSMDYLTATAASSLLIGGSTSFVGFVSISSLTVSVLTVALFTAVTIGRVATEFPT